MAHAWDIIEHPLGHFTIREVVKNPNTTAKQYGPFPDKPAAEKGLKRAIREAIYKYDETGKEILP